MNKLTSNIWITASLAAVIVLGGTAGIAYWLTSQGRVYTDNALVSAPITSISPSMPGTLQEVYVNVGDIIAPDTVVARVGNELLKAKNASIVTSADTAIGTIVSPATAVVQVVDPADLHIVAHIDEDKGLADLRVGDQAV